MGKNSERLGGAPTCFRCGRENDGFTNSDLGGDGRPENLDIGICLYCSAVLQYNIDETTNPPTVTMTEASAEVVADHMVEISKAQRVLKRFREMEKKESPPWMIK